MSRHARPRGYSSRNHETIGSDIIAINNALALCSQVLGPQQTAWLKSVKPDQWYPIETLLEALECVEKLGRSSLVQVGRKLFASTHARGQAKPLGSVADLVFGIDGMYLHANRGDDIGGWKVLQFKPGLARLEKTTPHPCPLEEGILTEALVRSELVAFVRQTKCVREGHDCCVFELSSFVTDHRWKGQRDYFG